MYSFEFDNIIHQFDEVILNKGIYLSVVHANKIPPHIGIVVDGKYFSLKANGKDINNNDGAIKSNIAKCARASDCGSGIARK